MLAAADLGIQRAVLEQIDPEEPAVGVFLHVVLIHAVDGEFIRGLSTLADQPEYLGDRIAKRPNCAYPQRHVFVSPRKGLAQPMAVFRKVEFAGSTRNRTSVLDGVQEIGILERLQKGRANSAQLSTAVNEIAYQGIEPFIVNAGLALKALQNSQLLIEFFVHLTANISAGQNRQDFKQARNRGTGSPIAFQLAVIQHLLVEKFQSHERTHPFGNRLLVIRRNAGRRLSGYVACRFRHRAILRYT